MSETIISSLISGGVAILVCAIPQIVSQKKSFALMEYKLDELNKKVDRTYPMEDRIYKLEQKAEVQEEKIKTLERNIS